MPEEASVQEQVQAVFERIPEGGVPRPEQQAPPGPLSQEEERAALVAAYTAEWNRQVEWRMHIRRSAALMLESAAGNPCHSGTNSWIRDLGVPALDEDYNGYMRIGDEARALNRARLALAFSEPATLTTMSNERLPQRTEALRRGGELWRDEFLRRLAQARRNYPNITLSMETELIALLNAPAQGAPFPDYRAQVAAALPAPVPVPALAQPQTVRMMVAILVPLEITGPPIRMDDGSLQQHVTERLRETLRRSVSRTPDARLGSAGISVVVQMDRR